MARKKANISSIKTAGTQNRGIIALFPNSLRKYLIVSRLDRPTGYILLWLPNVWGALGAYSVGNTPLSFLVFLCVLTLVGSIAMRAAGCVWNDFVDKDFDKQVQRTKNRPIASGSMGKKHVYMLLLLHISIGFAVFLFLPFPAKVAGVLALIPVAIYPFAKRFTYWPQAWLGVAFNWGVWIGWLSVTQDNLGVPLLLHMALIFWTLGYDTIYAHQDRQEDIVVGIKSSAIKLGERSAFFIGIFYSISSILFVLVGIYLQFSLYFYCALVVVSISLFYQVVALDIKNSRLCLFLFKYNVITGLCITGAMIIGVFTK